jgi:hypothetical protein
MARPTKLNGEVRKKLIDATLAGCTLKDTAACAGISMDSFYRYRAKDPELAAALAQAEGTAAVGYTFVVKRASDNGDWRAAAWWLERRRPEEWSLKRIHEVSGTDGSPIRHEHGFTLDPEKCTVEELEVIERVMVRQLAAQAEAGEG